MREDMYLWSLKDSDSMTARRRLIDIDPARAREIGKRIGQKAASLALVRKYFAPPIDGVVVNKAEPVVTSVITTDGVDRDGEIMVAEGGMFDDFLRQGGPVMWCHNYKALPLGRCLALAMNKDRTGIQGRTLYNVDNNPFAERVYKTRASGFQLGESIGFIPVEWEPLDPKRSAGAVRKILKWYMLEYSDTPMPVNPEAVQVSIEKGLMTPEEAQQWLPARIFVIPNPLTKSTPAGHKEDAPMTVATENKAVAGAEQKGPVSDRVAADVDTYVCTGCGAVVKAMPGAVSTCPQCQAPFEGHAETTQPTAATIEKAIAPRRVVTKMTDLDGIMGVGDIVAALGRASGSSFYIADLYPVEYPNGHAVLCRWDMNKPELMLVEYSIDAEGEAVIASETSVEPGYKLAAGKGIQDAAVLQAVREMKGRAMATETLGATVKKLEEELVKVKSLLGSEQKEKGADGQQETANATGQAVAVKASEFEGVTEPVTEEDGLLMVDLDDLRSVVKDCLAVNPDPSERAKAIVQAAVAKVHGSITVK